MAGPRLPFKEMCEKFDVTPRTLRYYEYIELLSPERDSRSRFYGSRELARMTLILRGRRFGFSLEEIRQWLLMYEEDGPSSQFQVFLDYSTRRLEDLKQQRDALNKTINELETLRSDVKSLIKQQLSQK